MAYHFCYKCTAGLAREDRNKFLPRWSSEDTAKKRFLVTGFYSNFQLTRAKVLNQNASTIHRLLLQ